MVNEEVLRDWIQEHSVCWESSPMVEMYEGRRTQVGFELNLFGRHPALVHSASGRNSEGLALYQKLKAIALFSLPSEIRPSRYEIDPYHAALHFRPENGLTPEIQLTIRVLHREQYFDPIDACESRCANEITARLCALGAQKCVWNTRSAQRSHSLSEEVAS